MEPVCLRCQTRLDLSQPQVEDPVRILGVCSACGRWHSCLDGLVTELPVPTLGELGAPAAAAGPWAPAGAPPLLTA